MFSMDKILLEFIGANWMSLYVLITLLKGAALLTKSTTDDKIATLLGNLFSNLRKGRAPDTIAPLVAETKAKEGLKETPQTSDTVR